MAAIYLTRKGYEHLNAELRELVDVRRPQVMADLVQAREYGDIRENAEYETAKRDQGLTEGRIHELEGLLSSVEILDVPTEPRCAVMGATLKIRNLETSTERICTLVAEQEAHVDDCYLSVTSPLGAALLGSVCGATVTFQAPAGVRRFEILALVGDGQPLDE